MSDKLQTSLAAILNSVINGKEVLISDWSKEFGSIESWGLRAGARGIELSYPCEWLDAEKIRKNLSVRAIRWIDSLEIESCISSTNDKLVSSSKTGSCKGKVCIAEAQIDGRGRRGRTWHTPLGGNIAISLGFELDRTYDELAGLSLVVGLSLLDTIQSMGIEGLTLKWPNDLLLYRKKLGGILVELLNSPKKTNTVQVLVGIGVNLQLNERLKSSINQDVADLASKGLSEKRNLLVSNLISSLVDYVGTFEEHGFSIMKDQYNLHHALNSQYCEIAIGPKRIRGYVEGIDDVGNIKFYTDDGQLTFSAGEVSLLALERNA
tara:strand:- start:812 stop:1774 length:963 start_codon:yes stop_codon:yes gene_type:complete